MSLSSWGLIRGQHMPHSSLATPTTKSLPACGSSEAPSERKAYPTNRYSSTFFATKRSMAMTTDPLLFGAKRER